MSHLKALLGVDASCMPPLSSLTRQQTPDLLRADEIADMCRVTPRTIRRWGDAGVLEQVRLGPGTVRYTRASVSALLSPHNDRDPADNGVSEKERGDGAHRSG